MKYQAEITAASASPEDLEDLYQAAHKSGEEELFKAAFTTPLITCFSLPGITA
jgi:hypothetical protein